MRSKLIRCKKCKKDTLHHLVDTELKDGSLYYECWICHNVVNIKVHPLCPECGSYLRWNGSSWVCAKCEEPLLLIPTCPTCGNEIVHKFTPEGESIWGCEKDNIFWKDQELTKVLKHPKKKFLPEDVIE